MFKQHNTAHKMNTFYKLQGVCSHTIIQPLKVKYMTFQYNPFHPTHKYGLTIYTTKYYQALYKTELECMLEINNIRQIQKKYVKSQTIKK